MTNLLTEKRHWERVSFFRKLVVQETISGRNFESNGINISVGGIRFYSKKIFQTGARISIQICMNNKLHTENALVNAIVKWSKIEQDGAVTGAQFETSIKPADHPILYKMIYEQSF